MSRPPYVSFRVERRSGSAGIVQAVLDELARGTLPAGSRLPPVRVLEQQLGISKNTVQVAYDELMARGVVETREREGVFVAGAGRPMKAPPLPQLRELPALGPGTPRGAGTNLSAVFIDPELLPHERLAECARSVMRSPGLATHYDPQGYRPLREVIAARLSARAMDVDPDEIIITTGSQQSLDIVARSLATKRVACESPVYAYAKLLFESLGNELVGLHLDPFRGIDLDAWDKALATKPSLAYLIPSFHNPTGYSYSSGELRGVLDLCQRHGVAVLEDDWGSDMLSDGEYRPMLRMLGGKNVLYVNSFTKKLLPSLRVGFVAASPELVPTLVAMKRLSTLGNAWITEAVVAEFLDRGYYDTHLASLQRALDTRYAACLQALDELMPDGVRWTRPGGGPTLWVELPRSVDMTQLEAHLLRRGVHVSNASAAFLGVPHLHGFRVSYAYLSETEMRSALTILADALRTLG